VEGLYANSGDLAPIRDLVALKTKFCFRLILDDSMAFGVLGSSGRGSTEHAGIPTTAVDILVASLETAAASAGGFCIGTKEVVDHQRLSGAGYCFSASMPPFLCVSGEEAVRHIASEPERRAQLFEATVEARRILGAVTGVTVSGAEMSPIMHLRWHGATVESYEAVAQAMLAQGIALSCARYCPRERSLPSPSLRVCMSARYDKHAATAALETLAGCIKGHTLDSAPMTPLRAASWSSLDAALESSEAKPRSQKPGGYQKLTPGLLSSEDADARDIAHGAFIPRSQYAPRISVPVVSCFVYLLAAMRAHLAQQITWGTKTTLMVMRRLRNPVFDAYFEFWAHAGSEVSFLLFLLVFTWNVDTKISRSLAMLFALNAYVNSFLKNVFCLPRPMGDKGDFGWPSVLASTGVSLPFFLLHTYYGTVWIWDDEDPWRTMAVYSFTFICVGSMCATRLYFCSCSPADVQAGGIIGAILLRLWMVLAEEADAFVMAVDTWWYFPVAAILLLIIHPTPSLVNMNETYKFCISTLGFLSGYLCGATQPSIFPLGRNAQDPSAQGFTLRVVVGMSILQCFSLSLDYGYPRLVEALVKATVGRQAAVPVWARNLLKFVGRFSTKCASGFIAAWAVPRVLQALEL